MKFLVTACTFFIAYSILAQSPNGISYQAVATDTDGVELANQNISVRFTIVSGTPSGVYEYVEVHTATTDEYGLFNLVIGQGSYDSGNAFSLEAIDWGGNTHYLKVDMDPDGGNLFVNMGTQQMMSVPYALYAETSGSGGGEDADSDPTNEIQTLSIEGDQLSISGGNTVEIELNYDSILNVLLGDEELIQDLIDAVQEQDVQSSVGTIFGDESNGDGYKIYFSDEKKIYETDSSGAYINVLFDVNSISDNGYIKEVCKGGEDFYFFYSPYNSSNATYVMKSDLLFSEIEIVHLVPNSNFSSVKDIRYNSYLGYFYWMTSAGIFSNENGVTQLQGSSTYQSSFCIDNSGVIYGTSSTGTYSLPSLGNGCGASNGSYAYHYGSNILYIAYLNLVLYEPYVSYGSCNSDLFAFYDIDSEELITVNDNNAIDGSNYLYSESDDFIYMTYGNSIYRFSLSYIMSGGDVELPEAVVILSSTSNINSITR